MKLIERILSRRPDSAGKSFEVYKAKGPITGTNLFFAILTGADKGDWFHTQRDMHMFLGGNFVRDTATGKVIKVERKHKNTETHTQEA